MFLAIKADVRPKQRRLSVSIKEIVQESFKLVHREVGLVARGRTVPRYITRQHCTRTGRETEDLTYRQKYCKLYTV